MMDIGSGPIQNAMARITAQPVKAAVTKEETMANGTAFAALEASSKWWQMIRILSKESILL
jgi:hypothetical protein